MKKRIIMTLVMMTINCMICIASLEAKADTITFSCDTTSSLTKNITIGAASNVTITWGDGISEEITKEGDEQYISHTYQTAGTYSVSLTATEITKLGLTGNDIIDVSLVNALSLQNLDISSNKLSAISVSQNTALTDLNCSNNYLTEIKDLPGAISILNCSGNKINSLVVPNTIKEMNANNNLLTGINGLDNFDLSGFANLTVLKCVDNKISSLILTGCTALEKIDFSNNLVSEVDFSDNTLLKEVYCSSNFITSINIVNNNMLEILNCNGNSITSLNLAGKSNLKKLYVLKNEIESIDLGNISCEVVLVDSSVNITNNASSLLLRLGIEGNGSVALYGENTLIFSQTPEKITVNGSELGLVADTLDISKYTGDTTIIVTLSSGSLENMVNVPQVLDGMIPVKHNGTNWVVTTKQDSEWYSYSESNMKWANVMLRDGAKYLDLDGVTLKDVGSIAIDALVGKEIPENATGSMYVWIPRFSYKISGSEVLVKYSGGLSDYLEEDYITHPAFNYANYLGGDTTNQNSYTNMEDSDKVLGFWIAKYPAGNALSAPKYASNVSVIKDANISDAFSASKLVTTSSNYQLNDGESHMVKNSEWGAVAYLTTAMGNISNNSTTGNIYGIYGMDNGEEFVSSFIELVGGISNLSVRKNGLNLIPYTIIKYNQSEVAKEKDLDIVKLKTEKDNPDSNKDLLENFKGFGINEVGSSITGTITDNMPASQDAFFTRGIDGIYSYSGSNGASSSGAEFRNVIIVKSNVIETAETYTISSGFEGSGTISPIGNTVVEKGSSLTYAIKPNDGYEIVDILVDGNSVYYDIIDQIQSGSYVTYQFTNISKNHTIVAKFDSEVAVYEVTVEKKPVDHGEVIGAGSYSSRSDVTLQANNTTGYKFSSWELLEAIEGFSINTTSSILSFKMPSRNVKLRANFEQILEAELVVENMNTAVHAQKDVGKIVRITANIPSGYTFSKWAATGIDLEDQVNNATIEIEMPSNDVYLVAEYNKI